MNVLELTAKIVAAHVAKNQLGPDALPSLIQSVYLLLATIDDVPEVSAALFPAVPWKKSVFPDFIICLEDGRRLKMLKRHLKVQFGLTPDQYREKWGLPADYPMVAPSSASRRLALARQIGSGRKRPAEPRTDDVSKVLG